MLFFVNGFKMHTIVSTTLFLFQKRNCLDQSNGNLGENNFSAFKQNILHKENTPMTKASLVSNINVYFFLFRRKKKVIRKCDFFSGFEKRAFSP